MENLDMQTEKRWRDIKGSYRRAYPNLTDGDITYREGELDNMTDRVAKKTDRSRGQVLDEIRGWDMDQENREREQ